MKCIRGARIFTSVLLALTIVHSAANSRPVAKTQLVNVMPAFWAFQDELGSMKRTENIVRRFRQQIIKPNWRVYSKDEFSKNITDEGIATYIKQVQPDLSAMRSLTSRIGPQTNVALERFAQAFPQFGEVSITYLPSFYRFDGQVTKIKGEYAVLFGLDGIARYHGVDADLGVLLSHELFHIYHARTSPTLFADEEHMPLYVGVWIEGLATYVSEQLNPQASTLQILLDDKALLDRGMPMAGAIASMILEHFDSAKPEDTGRFLSFGEKDNIPGRSGYLVGYLIAKRLGADQTLPDLASLTGERLRVTMHEELRQLAATKVANDQGPARDRLSTPALCLWRELLSSAATPKRPRHRQRRYADQIERPIKRFAGTLWKAVAFNGMVTKRPYTLFLRSRFGFACDDSVIPA